jgi:hypothetical protein
VSFFSESSRATLTQALRLRFCERELSFSFCRLLQCVWELRLDLSNLPLSQVTTSSIAIFAARALTFKSRSFRFCVRKITRIHRKSCFAFDSPLARRDLRMRFVFSKAGVGAVKNLCRLGNFVGLRNCNYCDCSDVCKSHFMGSIVWQVCFLQDKTTCTLEF